MSIVVQPYKLKGEGSGFRTYVNGTAVSRKPVELERAIQQWDALKKAGEGDRTKAYALSETDMKKVIPTLKVISYPDLLKASSIDQVLDEKGRLMLLYLTENRSTGHWVCLLKLRGTNIIEYFDPYGHYKPDGEKKWLTPSKRREFGQDTDYLTELLNSSGYVIKSNAIPFQKDKADINTCGRHCLTRLYFKHLTLPQYADMVKSTGIPADDFVTGFTQRLIGR
jgi:hypothetical protein